MKVRLSGSPFLLVTPGRFRRIQQCWSELRANRQAGLKEYMVNNVIRDFRVHATRAGCNLDGMLTTHAFRKSCGRNWANQLPVNVGREFMGRSDIKATAEFYTAVTKDHFTHAQWAAEAVAMKGDGETDVIVTPRAETAADRKVG